MIELRMHAACPEVWPPAGAAWTRVAKPEAVVAAHARPAQSRPMLTLADCHAQKGHHDVVTSRIT